MYDDYVVLTYIFTTVIEVHVKLHSINMVRYCFKTQYICSLYILYFYGLAAGSSLARLRMDLEVVFRMSGE